MSRLGALVVVCAMALLGLVASVVLSSPAGAQGANDIQIKMPDMTAFTSGPTSRLLYVDDLAPGGSVTGSMQVLDNRDDLGSGDGEYGKDRHKDSGTDKRGRDKGQDGKPKDKHKGKNQGKKQGNKQGNKQGQDGKHDNQHENNGHKGKGSGEQDDSTDAFSITMTDVTTSSTCPSDVPADCSGSGSALERELQFSLTVTDDDGTVVKQWSGHADDLQGGVPLISGVSPGEKFSVRMKASLPFVATGNEVEYGGLGFSLQLSLTGSAGKCTYVIGHDGGGTCHGSGGGHHHHWPWPWPWGWVWHIPTSWWGGWLGWL